MDREEQVRAFAMRCEGRTWEEIGRAFHYDGNAIRASIQRAIEPGRHIPAYRTEALRNYMIRHHDGSVQQLADRMGVSPHRLRRVLVNGDAPSARLLRRITLETGLTAEQITGGAEKIATSPPK